MPLLDHFRPPLSDEEPWESIHSGWAYEMANLLNRSLKPRGFRARHCFQLGTHLQVDVGALESRPSGSAEPNGAGGVAVAAQTYAPPAAPLVAPFAFPDDAEVQVFRTEGGLRLVGAVELVSPSNKDRPETRRGFAAKCATYLQRGIGLVVVDVVTVRQQNLHDELVELLGLPDGLRFPADSPLYAVAYRPGKSREDSRLEVWPFPLPLGQDLPTVPLALLNGPTVPLDLEASYRETRARMDF